MNKSGLLNLSSMERRSTLKVSLFLISIGLACAAAYHFIGTYVDEEGVLHEPFGLIPISWFFLLSGLVTGLFYLTRVLIQRIVKSKKQREE